MNFSKHIFTYTIVLLFILATVSSYYRFIYTSDYIVSYEGYCNEYSEVCYIGCKDDECIEEYYYNLVTRNATDIKALCGNDITNCMEADYCQENELTCSIEFCDVSSGECEEFTDEDKMLKSEKYELDITKDGL